MRPRRTNRVETTVRRHGEVDKYILYVPRVLIDNINDIIRDEEINLYFRELLRIIRKISKSEINILDNSTIMTTEINTFKRWKNYFDTGRDRRYDDDEIIISRGLILNTTTMEYYRKGRINDITSLFKDIFKYKKDKSSVTLALLYMYYDKINFYKYLDEFIEDNKLDNSVIKLIEDEDDSAFFKNQTYIGHRIQQKLGINSRNSEYALSNADFYFFYIRFLYMKRNNQKSLLEYKDHLYYFYPVFKYFSRVNYETKFGYISNQEALEILSNEEYISEGIYKLKEVEEVIEENFEALDIYKDDIMDILFNINQIYNPRILIEAFLYQIIIKDTDMRRIFDILRINKNVPLTIENVIKFITLRRLDNFIPRDFTNLKMLEEDVMYNSYTIKELVEITGFQVPKKKVIESRKYFKKIMTKENFTGIFIPLKDRRCNPELDGDEISYNSEEDYEYIFAIGNNNKYRCYDFEEVEKVMTLRDQLAIYDFETNTYNLIDKELAENLLMLTKKSEYPNKKRFVELLKKLIRDLKFDVHKNFNNLSANEKLLLKDFFLSIFYIGMLTRRWNPDDKKYPMKEENTLHGDRGVTEGTMSIILSENFRLFKENILDHLTDKLKHFLNSIPCMTKHDNRIEEEDTSSDRKILKLLYRTFEEKDFEKVVCQRIASNALITTGDYYLKLLFNYQIPNFNINKMKTII